MRSSDFYGLLLIIMLIVGGMSIYFPAAWPRFEKQIFIPYILWFVLLCICFIFLQPKRGAAILNNFKNDKGINNSNLIWQLISIEHLLKKNAIKSSS